MKFLFQLFTYNLHTLQFKGERNGRSHNPVQTFLPDEYEKAAKLAGKYNKQGYDVYFMVNEGDGVTHEGQQIPRCQSSVTTLSKCFIDTDTCPKESVDTYLDSIGLTPHLIIESSLHRYHYYFFIEELPKTPSNIFKWRGIQNMLMRLGDASIENPTESLGTDKTMNDYAKLLRVPGFYHISKKSLVKVIMCNDIPYYSAQEMYDLTDAQVLIDYQRENHTASTTNVPDLLSTDVIMAGDRFGNLQSLALHLANQSMSRANAAKIFTDFVVNRCDNTDGIYHNGVSLTTKSLSLLDSALSKVVREQEKTFDLMAKSMPMDIEVDPSINSSDSWYLPDSFYLNAPNGFGDIVRQVMDASLYPCAALSFGTFLAGISILKARTHISLFKSSPALYVLNVAPSGYGKGDPFSILQNTFVNNGLSKFIGNKIRSDRGIYNDLQANDGYKLYLLDEIAPFLTAIQSKTASPHHAYINEAILSIYSLGSTKGVRFGSLASSGTKKGEPEIVIDNPCMGICGYTVPSSFSAMFNESSVLSGLFQRFIIVVPEIKKVIANVNADKNVIIKGDLIASHAIPAEDLDDDGNPVEPIQSQTKAKTTIKYTPAAFKHFLELQDMYRDKLILSAKDPETAHTSGLYSRLAEQIDRVATTLSIDEVSYDTLEYAREFIESRHKATMVTAEETVVRGAASGSIDKESKVLVCLAKSLKESNEMVMGKRELYQKARRSFVSMKEFDQTLIELQALGKIEYVRGWKGSSGNIKSRVALGIRLGDVLN